MALYKSVIQDDGVVTNYHRILYLQTTVNRQNSIVVLSYTDTDIRTSEKENELMEPYRKAVTYETDYDETMNIETAYNYLKTLPQFEWAEDV